MIRIFRIWIQTLVPPVITITLYFIIFGSFIGSQIGDMNGYSYMAYIAPGLIMMAIITNSYSNTVSSFSVLNSKETWKNSWSVLPPTG